MAETPKLEKIPNRSSRNVIFFLTDDHRYDVAGYQNHPFVETPGIDSLASRGVEFENAFVTTSLCSPSRASILTGLYAHRHRVVNNTTPDYKSLTFFSQYLKQAGYQTAFIGKWHMGGIDKTFRAPGWDHWVSFGDQGKYYPVEDRPLFVDGREVPQKGYITDELTGYAVRWLDEIDPKKPFMLYLSHKGIHGDFTPARRHAGRYADQPLPPSVRIDLATNGKSPMWVQNQRNSYHGIDFPYHSTEDVATMYRRYCEALLSIDESLGALLDWLRNHDLLESTLVIYMGDNGFSFGEHGLIDKRTAYEESMRVPLLMQCPDLFRGGIRLKPIVANIDIAPTVLDAAGLQPPAGMDGRSLLPLAEEKDIPWRKDILYEYFWEHQFPQTPTVFAIRNEHYKYIRPIGLWDQDELYDLKKDPGERINLIDDPSAGPVIERMNQRLWEVLRDTGGMNIPLLPFSPDGSSNLRRKNGAPAADFPAEWIREDPPGK